MKKFLSLALCFIMVLASSQAIFAAAVKKSTIKVGIWDASTTPYIQTMVDAFEDANPNITVELVDTPSADYTTKLSVQLNGGSDIDAFWIKDGDTTRGLADKGQLLDLSPYIIRDEVNLAEFNGLAKMFQVRNKTIALPARSDYYVLFYNKDIFDAAGVEYPSNDMTWAEYEALCAKLTSGEGTDKVYGGFLHTWQALVQNWAVQDGENTIMATDYSFMKPYYEMALRLQEAGDIMDYGTLRTGNIHYSGVFASGQVATMPMGTFYLSNIIGAISRGESDVNWGIATIPHPENVEAGWTVGSVTPIAVNARSRNKDAAWEFVKFVTGTEGAQIYAEGFAFPGRSNTAIKETIATADGMPEGALDALQVTHIALDRPYMDNVAEVNQMLGEQHSLIMLGEDTIDNVLEEMAKQSEEIQD